MAKRTFPRPYPFNLPGVTASWLARANGCSLSTVRRHRRLTMHDEAGSVHFVTSLSAEKGLAMTHVRAPRGVLTLWSRMAIAEFADRGATYAELMAIFKVGRSTVYRALHHSPSSFCPLSGRRRLTIVQAAPLRRR